jgi:hypothetical protein
MPANGATVLMGSSACRICAVVPISGISASPPGILTTDTDGFSQLSSIFVPVLKILLHMG